MSANAATLDTTVSTRITREMRHYRVRYQVLTTEKSDQGLQALTASGLPSRGDYYEAGDNADVGAFWDGYDTRLVNKEGSRKYWEVLVDFSSRPSNSDPAQPTSQEGYDFPWNEPTELSGDSRVSELQMAWHYTNPSTGAWEVIRNSFGDPRTDEYREFSHATLRLRKKYHVNSWSSSVVDNYIDSVNTATFFGHAAGYYRLEAPRWSLHFTGGGIAYWDVEYSFAGKTGGWNGERKVDEGERYRDHSDDDKVKRFSDDALQPIGVGRLDGEGDALDTWANPVIFPGGGLNKYAATNFGALPIPTSVTEILQGG